MGVNIDVLEKHLCYSEFYHRYLVANKPCLLSELWTESWPCRKLWVKNGQPDWEFLKRNYGNQSLNHWRSGLLQVRIYFQVVLRCPSLIVVSSIMTRMKKLTGSLGIMLTTSPNMELLVIRGLKNVCI